MEISVLYMENRLRWEATIQNINELEAIYGVSAQDFL